VKRAGHFKFQELVLEKYTKAEMHPKKNDGLEPTTCAPTERQSFHADADAYDDANDLGSFFSPFLHPLSLVHIVASN
jgi:hypothetical protein